MCGRSSGPICRRRSRDVQPTVAFQYDRQPWSLRARVVARPMVVHVTPDYALELGADEARLRVHLVYQVPGARAFEFRVRLQGWELTAEPIESSGLVDRDGVVVTRDGVLVLPLAQASSRRAEITIWLRRTIARDATELELPLPVPEADTVAAAELVVAADAAIELLPDMAESRGLSPTPVTSDAPIAAAEDGKQLFRYRSFVPDAVFAAQRTIRPSEVTDGDRRPSWPSTGSGSARRKTLRTTSNISRLSNWHSMCRTVGRSSTTKSRSCRRRREPRR